MQQSMRFLKTRDKATLAWSNEAGAQSAPGPDVLPKL